MPYKIMQDVVAKRREEYPEYDFLSDYQVHSANLVSSTIHGKAQQQSLDVGPVYVPFPTGSGKTVGAIWGITKVIEQYPDKRICFLTPYKTAVDQMYQALVKHLGSDKVGMYYSMVNDASYGTPAFASELAAKSLTAETTLGKQGNFAIHSVEDTSSLIAVSSFGLLLRGASSSQEQI